MTENIAVFFFNLVEKWKNNNECFKISYDKEIRQQRWKFNNFTQKNTKT